MIIINHEDKAKKEEIQDIKKQLKNINPIAKT